MQLVYLYFTQYKQDTGAFGSVYRRLFSNAGIFTFVITGNFDPEKYRLYYSVPCVIFPGQITKKDFVAR